MDVTPGNTHSADPPRTATGSAFAAITSAFGWLMCTLAAGAVAAFAAIVFGVRPCWLILLLALPLTVVLKACGCLSARTAGSIAALAVLLASVYAECLIAVARIAVVTGSSFGQAFRVGGVGLMLQVAELGIDVIAVLVIAGAAALAAILAAWFARRAAAS